MGKLHGDMGIMHSIGRYINSGVRLGEGLDSLLSNYFATSYTMAPINCAMPYIHLCPAPDEL